LQAEVDRILSGFDDPRVHIIVTKAFLNVSVKMNYAKEFIKSEYVARMDSDDISLPERFKKQVAFMQDHPKVGICGGMMEYINEDGTHNGYLLPPCSYFMILLSMRHVNPIANPTFIMRARDYMALSYDPTINTGVEDYDYWVRAARRGIVMRNIPDIVLKYRLKDRTKLKGAFYERNGQRAKDERDIQNRARGLVFRNIRGILGGSG
jgi:glycosyltransferase involved in cell wall biosynthesis